MLGKDDAGVEVGEDFRREHALRDGSGKDAAGDLRSQGVRGGSDALVGLQVEPFARVRPLETHLQIELGVVQEEVGRERVHPLPPEEDEVVATIDRDVDGGVGVRAVSPMHAAVAVAKGEGKGGDTVVVHAVDCQLARIRHGSGGQGPRKQKGKEKKKKVFHGFNQDRKEVRRQVSRSKENVAGA